MTELEEVFTDYLRRDDPDAGDVLEMPIRRRSITIVLLATMALFVVFGIRVFSLTVLEGSLLTSAAERSRARTVEIPAVRGAILDRNGVVLVENAPSFELVYDPLAEKATPEAERRAVLERVSAIVGLSPEDLSSRIAPYRNQAESRVIVPEISHDAAVAILAAMPSAFLRPEATFERRYPQGGELFAPVVGYIGPVTAEELRAHPSYGPHDRIGKSGIERQYETELRGVPGQRRIIVDASGTPRDEQTIVEPVNGANVRLTIDADLTEVAYAALRDAMRASRATGAALVAMDPRDGAIRALLSLPSYDPSVFRSSAAYERLASDPRKPFLNRAIAGLYPPGSTIKPFIATAALAERVISPSRRIDASAGFIRVRSIYDPNVSWTFRDWRPQGIINMIDAIAQSSDVYFYTVGGGYGDIRGLGAERIARYFRAFGFGQRLGIDLDAEAEGRIPTPDWKEKEIGEPWYIGDTYNLSIGQGALAVTPLQLATATAAVANGGVLVRPHLLDAVVGADGSVVRGGVAEPIGRIPASDDELATVRQGMRASVTSPRGTNKLLADLPLEVAAKTGTAQFGSGGKTHALVTAFAPLREPEIVLAILLEGGGEGTVASRVAKEILSWYASHRR